MKILFITYHFPPYNSVGAVRTSKTAKYLVEAGHEVKVLTCGNQLLPDSLSLEIPEKNVEYTPWFNINSPVSYVLGGTKQISTKGYVPSIRYFAGCTYFLGTFYRNLLNFPDGQIGWFPFAKRFGNQLIHRWKPDLIFGSAIPNTALLVASTLSKKHNIPWVAELRDLWVDNHQWVRPAWRHFFEKKLERHVLSSASGLVTVSSPLAEILQSKYSQPCEIITNGFDPDDYPDSPKVPSSNGVVHLVHTGQLFNHWRDPSPLFSALELMGDEAEKVRVHFFGRYLNLVREMAMKHNVSHLVQTHEPVSHIEALRIQSEADILLLIPGAGNKNNGVFTTKLFEYLGARRPILCVGDDGGVASNLIQGRGAGITFNEPEGIARQMRQWIKQKHDKGGIPHLPSTVGEGYSRKEQTDKLIRFLESCLKKSEST
ncbi:MAG: glycosyltransferase family 4 protein [Nitrospina sp.]|jgi:glycosyltransferase involved in cell wall biosynthesis|nr:glycosyltransferase family 4 protein [Nitrospina sp.]MBT3875021.1 glycosyltransferase family 4 protein [Nitrospina sp.]MBT4049672.1 glycosyltransferase family 4 protein [Nitrospina sp.]MBT4556331.1 glycosyltransferase family 4 protein [Nitrospina sp.]MBT5652072.1 glycosyltransferase family 4 protein [Nitrospina sp.]